MLVSALLIELINTGSVCCQRKHIHELFLLFFQAIECQPPKWHRLKSIDWCCDAGHTKQKPDRISMKFSTVWMLYWVENKAEVHSCEMKIGADILIDDHDHSPRNSVYVFFVYQNSSELFRMCQNWLRTPRMIPTIAKLDCPNFKSIIKNVISKDL